MVKVAPSLTSPSKAWASIKEDEDETETTSLLEKMKEVVDGMQRRRSMQPEAIANVPISNKSEEDDKDAGLQGEMLKTEEAVPLQMYPRKPAQPFPATPHMSDLKHVFSENRAANVPSSYAGVRRLFKTERAPNPETPRLDGMREMFNRARELEPNTPAFEGVGEMLATSAEYQATRQGNEVELENTAEEHARSQSVKRPEVKSVDSDHPGKPSSRIAVKTSGVRPMYDGRVTPTDVAQYADDEMPEVLDKPSDHSANTAKGSTARRTDRRVKTEVNQVIIVNLGLFPFNIWSKTDAVSPQDTAVAPTKPASRARKVITPEITEQAPTQPKPVALQPGPARRSRAATKSTESTESEPTKPTRKTTTRRTKAGTASEAGVETEAEPAKGGLRRGTRTRNQSVEAPAAPAPVPAPVVKRRVGAKSKKAADVTLDPPAEEGGPDPSLGGADSTEHPEMPPTEATAKAGTPSVRGQRGKTKVAAPETEDESTGTDVGTTTLRVARGGKRTPTANVGTTTGAASNRAMTATATAGKGRRAGAAASSGKNAARTVGEKENTPEQIHVKEEEDEKLQLPSGAVATKSGRARKGAAVAVPKALSETEKDVTAPKSRAPRKRAASGKK